MTAERAERDDPSRGGPVAARLRPLRSVRVRITVAAVLVTAAAMAPSAWLLVRSVEDSQRSAIRDDAEDLLDRVAERLAAGVPPDETIRRAEELTAGPVEIVDKDGNAVSLVPVVRGDEVSVGIIERGPSSAAPSDELVAGAAHTPTSNTPDSGGESLLVVMGQPAASRTVDTPSGEMTVTVAVPGAEIARSVHAVRRALTIGLPLLLVLVALAAWRIVGRALRPVERMRAEADAISASTLHRRVSEPGTGDEVHRLSRTMNAMLERLQGAVSRQRQFVADASHELRNPVAGIRTDLEVALCEGDRADWPNVARGVLAEEARLETLIGDLLVLAADDEGAPTPPGREVDLNELAAAEARPSRKVPVSLATGSNRVVVVGSHSQLQRALANLVDNAERHANSQVRIGTTNQSGWARLWVDDDGPGIPPTDRDRVFERFTRLDDSRTRDQGGTGLGLAVVRSIVTRHRGRVWAERSPLGGARLTIVLPTPSPSPRPQPRQNLTALCQNVSTTSTP
jgi:signal transduction histidine kinase